MTPAAQANRALKNKITSERWYRKNLARWIAEVVSNYRIGQTVVDPDSVPVLHDVLRTGYNKAIKDLTTIDIREFKAGGLGVAIVGGTDELLNTASRNISAVMLGEYQLRLGTITPEISKTASKHIQRVSALAVTEQWSQRQADAALFNYLKSQRLVIALTESQWVVEAGRRATVVSISDPLGNTIEQIVDLIEAGDINAAKKLSKQVMKLSKLPTGINQARVIGAVSDAGRVSLTTPLVQGRTIANLRAHAERLGGETKGWQPIGDSHTRETHFQAGAEYLANPIPIEQPFVVGGQLMQHPGDGSLGATLNEVINCRCAAIYF